MIRILARLAKWSIAGCLLVLSSCGHRVANDPQQALKPVSMRFGVSWPTNCLHQIASCWRYHALLDEGSDNLEVIARLEITRVDYERWRSSVTNIMNESPGVPLTPSPRLTNKYNWWNGHTYPVSQMTQFTIVTQAGSQESGNIFVEAVNTGDTYILFISAFLSRR